MLWPIVTRSLARATRIAAIDDQRSYTYAQLLGAAMHLAERIDSTTHKPHVGILLPTSGAFPIALLAIWLTRRVAVPLNYLLAPEELHYVIHNSEIDTLITTGPMLTHLNAGPHHHTTPHAPTPEIPPIPPGINTLLLETLDFSGFPPARWPPNARPDDLAGLIYTSGTHGRPKGVMLSHGNLRSNVLAGIQHSKITDSDILLGVLPQFHSFGFTAMTLIPLVIGAKVIYTARFLPPRIASLIRTHQPTVIMAIPSMYAALLTVKDLAPTDLRSIRLAISGGEPLPHVTSETYFNRLNLHILEGYGLTETSPITTWSTPWAFKPRAVGLPIPGVRLRIVEDHHQPRAPHPGEASPRCTPGTRIWAD
jgi:long-chain acyl-CoA synthetase